MRHLIIIAAFGLSSTAALAVEPASPSMHSDNAVIGSSSSGGGAGKVTFNPFSITRKEAVDKCPGGAAHKNPDGMFACDVTTSTPAGMAINEKGTAGTKGTTKKDQK